MLHTHKKATVAITEFEEMPLVFDLRIWVKDDDQAMRTLFSILHEMTDNFQEPGKVFIGPAKSRDPIRAIRRDTRDLLGTGRTSV